MLCLLNARLLARSLASSLASSLVWHGSVPAPALALVSVTCSLLVPYFFLLYPYFLPTSSYLSLLYPSFTPTLSLLYPYLSLLILTCPYFIPTYLSLLYPYFIPTSSRLVSPIDHKLTCHLPSMSTYAALTHLSIYSKPVL